jgi:Holliday junction resolvase RusA-like endonuclease
MEKHYVLKGDPIPLSRVRIGRNRNVYNPQRELKLITRITIESQHSDDPLFKGPLRMIAVFYMPIPESQKKKIKKGAQHFRKPDLDNLLKFICDLGNGLIWKDDALVAEAQCKKIYDPNPRTEFTIMELE